MGSQGSTGKKSTHSSGVKEARSTLDEHINYLSKEAYYKIRDEIVFGEDNEEIMKIFRDYKGH